MISESKGKCKLQISVVNIKIQIMEYNVVQTPNVVYGIQIIYSLKLYTLYCVDVEDREFILT